MVIRAFYYAVLLRSLITKFDYEVWLRRCTTIFYRELSCRR